MGLFKGPNIENESSENMELTMLMSVDKDLLTAWNLEGFWTTTTLFIYEIRHQMILNQFFGFSYQNKTTKRFQNVYKIVNQYLGFSSILWCGSSKKNQCLMPRSDFTAQKPSKPHQKKIPKYLRILPSNYRKSIFGFCFNSLD